MDITKQFTTNKAHTNVIVQETTDGLLFRASDIQSRFGISYAVFCLKKKKKQQLERQRANL